MLNVCGVTYDHTVNYGSCLQAYALQTVVENIELKDGTRCKYYLIPIVMINRKDDKKKRINKNWKSPIIRNMTAYFHFSFLSFEKNRMHFTSLYSIDELPRLNQEMDAFVCGSDLIWNPHYNHRRNSYYLDFATKYKFSYAASFGIDEIDEQTFEAINKPLQALNAISVREETGVKIISKYFHRTAQVVIDPVLLLKKNEWETLMASPRKKEKYIFVYRVALGNNIGGFVERLRKETGLPVVYAVVGIPGLVLRSRKIFIHKPDQWLQLLHDAEYVVTNSFHGTAFSVLFHKRFFSVVQGERSKGFNVRMNDLLRTLGLEDRLYSSVPAQIDLSEIEYQNADEKIAQMRDKSLEFLRDNLEKANEIRKMDNHEV